MSPINDAYTKGTPELKGLSPLMATRPTFLDGTKTAGLRDYELTDHLSNVMAVISDRKLSVDTNNDNITDYYAPQVVSYTDYYPFGFPIAERSGNLSGYRFGFNGQEADNEVYGVKQSYTAEFWQYDTRLGRRWNVDPLGPDYPWQSPYTVFNNNPIYYSDPTGKEGEPPEDQIVIKTGGGGYMNIPAAAKVEMFGSTNIRTTGSVLITVDANAAKAFTIYGNRYVAGFNKKGEFSGYYLSTDMKTQYTPEAILYQDKVSAGFKDKLLEISYNLGHDPNKLMAVMAQETGEKFTSDIGWADKRGAVGLIQFTSIAIKEINRVNGTNYTKQMLADMTPEEQLDVVQLYYQTPILKNKNFKTIEDYAVATFNPKYVGSTSSTVIYKRGETGYLSGLDMNGDGNITVGEVGTKYAKKYVK